MTTKSLITTLKAIQVALKDVNTNSKAEMQTRITIVKGFVESALEGLKPEAISHEMVYDDEDANYIRNTEDGI